MDCLAQTQRWLERAVIGLQLCPYAKAPHSKGLIRYVVEHAADAAAVASALERELLYLQATPAHEVETTLLIHPQALTDFHAYNDFLDEADRLLVQLSLDGVVQIASFHPHYQFAGSRAEDIGNATNQSPYPMLHLLREASIDAVMLGADDPNAVAAAIVARNQVTLAELGRAGWERLCPR